MYKHILVPTDGSEISARAMGEAVAFARLIGARITAVTVSPPFQLTGVPGDRHPPPARARAREPRP